MLSDRTIRCGGTQLVFAVHQTLPSFTKVGLACESSTRLGVNQDILFEILNISWSVQISQKVFQVHYLQYQAYCILQFCTSIIMILATAYMVAVFKLSLMGATLCKLQLPCKGLYCLRHVPGSF